KTRLNRALVSLRHPGQLPLADRTKRRCRIGLLLRHLLGEGALPITRFACDLFLDVPERMAWVIDAPVQAGDQAFLPIQYRLAKRFQTAVGRNRLHTAVAHVPSSITNPFPSAAQKMKCAPSPGAQLGFPTP